MAYMIKQLTVYGIDTKLPDGSELTRFPYNGEIHDIDEIHLPVTVVEWENEDDASEYNIIPETIDSDDTDSKMLYAYFSERLRRYDEWQQQSGSAKQADSMRKRHNSKNAKALSEVPPYILNPLDPLHRNFARVMGDDDEYTHIEIGPLNVDDNKGFQIAIKSETGESSIYGAIEGDMTAISLEDRHMAQMLYATVYKSIESRLLKGTIEDEDIIHYGVNIPVRELGNVIMAEHKGKGFSRDEIYTIIKRIKRFSDITGVLRSKQDPRAVARYPFLQWRGYDEYHNVLSFGAPFLSVLSRQVLIDAGVLDTDGQPRLTNRRQPQLLKANSYLIKSTILRQRNKRAVEMVRIICNTIEANDGSHEPSITAYSIIKQVDGYVDYLAKATSANRSKSLRTTFAKAFELLRTETFLLQAYPGIKLPEPSDYPAWPYIKTKRYFFSHNGVDSKTYAAIQHNDDASKVG